MYEAGIKKWIKIEAEIDNPHQTKAVQQYSSTASTFFFMNWHHKLKIKLDGHSIFLSEISITLQNNSFIKSNRCAIIPYFKLYVEENFIEFN